MRWKVVLALWVLMRGHRAFSPPTLPHSTVRTHPQKPVGKAAAGCGLRLLPSRNAGYMEGQFSDTPAPKAAGRGRLKVSLVARENEPAPTPLLPSFLHSSVLSAGPSALHSFEGVQTPAHHRCDRRVARQYRQDGESPDILPAAAQSPGVRWAGRREQPGVDAQEGGARQVGRLSITRDLGGSLGASALAPLG